MIILGFVLVFLGFTVALYCWGIKEFTTAIIFIVLFVFGVFLWVYDVSSPVEVTTKIITTNEPQHYGLDIEKDEEELVRIKVIKYNPSRFGAMWKEPTDYILILGE